MRPLPPTLAAVALLGLAARLPAHDFWIEPERFRTAPGERTEVALLVGHGAEVTPFARRAERIVRFDHVDRTGTRPIPGLEGRHPAGLAVPRDGGPSWVVYRSTRAFLTLPAERFEPYLREEGLEKVIALRADRGDAGAPGREAYSRCCKALLGTPGPDDAAFVARPVGLALELVPERDPRLPGADSGLPLRLLRDGRPVEGARVDLHPLRPGELGDPVATARTDADGRVRLSASGPGRWLVASVDMAEAAADVDADWESVWTTLAFEIGPPTAPASKHDAGAAPDPEEGTGDTPDDG
ncbi:MAG: DUF4198 domain-containing protein [Planctomycetota bacterium JB042]